MTKSKVFLLPFIFILCVITLAACGNKTEFYSMDENAVTETITIKFINSWGGNDSKAQVLQQIFDDFMAENPNIRIQNDALFGDDFVPKLRTDFASGNDPDVFGLWPGSDIRTLIKAGKVADLTDLLAQDSQWKNSFNDDMWEYTTHQNRIYGLPVEIIFEGLFVNKDLFLKHHVKIPIHYEELKEAVISFKSKGIIPIAYNSAAEGTYIYQNIAAILGGKEGIENPIHGDRINSCYIEAMSFMKELYELGAFPENAFTMNSNDRNNLFKDKKAAMIVQGSWFIGEFEKDDTVDIFPFPSLLEDGNDYGAIIYGLGGGTFYMSTVAWTSNPKRDASVKLLKKLTSKDTVALFAEKTGMISNVNIREYPVDYNRLTQKGQVLVDKAQVLVGPPDSFIYRSVWENIIVKRFPYFLEGQDTAEDLWQMAIERGVDEN